MQQKKDEHGLTPGEQIELDGFTHNYEARLEHCRKMIAMGLKVITGSDASWSDYKLGNTAYETECLVAAGMSPAQGVVSVTGDAATALGIDDVTGTLEEGKEAISSHWTATPRRTWARCSTYLKCFSPAVGSTAARQSRWRRFDRCRPAARRSNVRISDSQEDG